MSIEFSFNDIMYKQIDGVAMGSLLGPALANIFVGYHEGNISDITVQQYYFASNPCIVFQLDLCCRTFAKMFFPHYNNSIIYLFIQM